MGGNSGSAGRGSQRTTGTKGKTIEAKEEGYPLDCVVEIFRGGRSQQMGSQYKEEAG